MASAVADLMTDLQVGDLMTESVKSLGRRDSLLQAYDLMDSGHFRHVPVVDGDEVVGLLSERDLLKHALVKTAELPLSEQRTYLAEVKVEEVMISIPTTVAPDTDIQEAGQIILEYKIGCLPVVDNQKLVGILTESDFVRTLSEL